MIFQNVHPNNHDHLEVLFDLLQERTPEQSISHKGMPEWKDHVAFVQSEPYREWWLIVEKDFYVGAAYLTKASEIGIGIFKRFRGNGYGEAAVKEIMSRYAGPLLANINPLNTPSINLFTKLGFRQLQVTYQYEETDNRSRNGRFTFGQHGQSLRDN